MAKFLLNDKDGSTIARIENSSSNVTECCNAMIRQYLQNYEASWQHVIESLRNANYKKEATKIEKKMGINGMYLHNTCSILWRFAMCNFYFPL